MHFGNTSRVNVFDKTKMAHRLKASASDFCKLQKAEKYIYVKEIMRRIHVKAFN